MKTGTRPTRRQIQNVLSLLQLYYASVIILCSKEAINYFHPVNNASIAFTQLACHMPCPLPTASEKFAGAEKKRHGTAHTTPFWAQSPKGSVFRTLYMRGNSVQILEPQTKGKVPVPPPLLSLSPPLILLQRTRDTSAVHNYHCKSQRPG